MKQSHYNELMKIAADLETEGDGKIAKALRAAVRAFSAAPTIAADAEAPTHLSDGRVIDKSVVKRLAAQFGFSLADAGEPSVAESRARGG